MAKIRRRDIWRYPGHKAFVIPLALGLAFLGIAFWVQSSHTAFARSAVITTAVIEKIQRTTSEGETGRTYTFHGLVRFTSDGKPARARVRLAGRCRSTACAARYAEGASVTIGYDPHDPAHAKLAKGGKVPSGITSMTYGFASLAIITLGIASAVLIIGGEL